MKNFSDYVILYYVRAVKLAGYLLILSVILAISALAFWTAAGTTKWGIDKFWNLHDACHYLIWEAGVAVGAKDRYGDVYYGEQHVEYALRYHSLSDCKPPWSFYVYGGIGLSVTASLLAVIVGLVTLVKKWPDHSGHAEALESRKQKE